MPNWCSNNLTLRHEDPAKIQEAIAAFNEGKLFDHFVPCPPELLEEVEPGDDYAQRVEALSKRNMELHGYASWYDWHIDNWGTKWDISNEGFEAEASDDGKSVYLAFDTAWGPPIAWYHEMVDEHGFDVQATYFEPGMAFIGRYTTDGLDEYYEYGDIDRAELSEHIPQDLMDEYDLLGWLGDEDEDDVFEGNDEEEESE